MTRRPRSLFARLLGIAVLATLAALVFAGVAIGGVLERFVMRGLDDRLDAQVTVLARAVRADGTLDRARAVSLPLFDEAGSGWAWQVREAGGRRWLSDADAALAIVGPVRRGHDRHGTPHEPRVLPAEGEPVPAEGMAADGERVHLRQLLLATDAGPVLVIAGGPRRIVEAPLREAMVPLLASLALLGAGLGVATLVQLRLGLRPLRTIRTALAEVRAGRRRHIGEDQPAELLPLAQELNALIDQNAAGLANARRHVSNLAHGLKTPLASLGLRLAEPGRDPDGSLAALVARIDRQVRHHLGRARAAAPGGTGHARTPLGPAVGDLVAALARIHAERGIAARIDVPDGLVVASDPQDLDEMLGNLLDNAWRHARTAVSVGAMRTGAVRTGTSVRITIDDDGPGLTGEAIAQALIPGRRLDEQGDGHGFGLPIALELAQLNGGGLRLEPSPVTTGLRAVLDLPGADAAS